MEQLFCGSSLYFGQPSGAPVGSPSHAVGAGDAAGAREGLPRYLVAESAIMEFMAEKDSANWLGAICAIPKNLRSMYVHAYQVSLHCPSLPAAACARDALLPGSLKPQQISGRPRFAGALSGALFGVPSP